MYMCSKCHPFLSIPFLILHMMVCTLCGVCGRSDACAMPGLDVHARSTCTCYIIEANSQRLLKWRCAEAFTVRRAMGEQVLRSVTHWVRGSNEMEQKHFGLLLYVFVVLLCTCMCMYMYMYSLHVMLYMYLYM